MPIFNKKREIPEISFKVEADFEKEIFENSKLLFGKKTVLIEAKKKISGKALGGAIPDGFLFDFSDKKDPKFYIIEVELLVHDFYRHIFPQITKFFGFFKNSEGRAKLARQLNEIISSDGKLRNEFRRISGEKEIFKLITDLLENSQNILVLIDGEKPEFAEIEVVYSDTWGKMVKCLIVRKYAINSDVIFHLEPEFKTLDITGGERVLGITKEYDEEHHTKDANQDLVDIYAVLKNKLLEINPEITFNSTKEYIAIKIQKNLSFIQFRKKCLRLVVLRPEKEIQECVESTQYEIQFLPESVQKFWNGECAAILIQDTSGMDKIVNLLKPLILEN